MRLPGRSECPQARLGHGALPWRGDHDRRMVLYRFNPGHSAYTPGVAEFNCAPAQPAFAFSFLRADELFCVGRPRLVL